MASLRLAFILCLYPSPPPSLCWRSTPPSITPENQWAAVIFAYLFTWHALYTLKGEHQVFAKMRERYLSRGNADFMAQTRYTSKASPGVGRGSMVLSNDRHGDA